MIYKNNKISLRQSLLLFVVMCGSFSIRIVPSYTAKTAREAAWLTPLISLGIFLLYLKILSSLFKKNKEKSLVNIFHDILGGTLGSIVCIIYFLWITILNAYYLRMYAERIVSSIFPNVKMTFFILCMAGVVVYSLRSGITVIGRMNEIFFFFINVLFFIINIFVLPQVKVKHLYPITHENFLPVLKGSLLISSFWCYITFIFLLGDRINDKERFNKTYLQAFLYITFVTIEVIIIPLGVFGWSVVSKMPLPYFNTIQEIQLFNIIERLDALIFSTWVLTDFTLIVTLSLVSLHTLKQVIKTSDIKPFTNIYMVIVFILSLALSRNLFELQQFGIVTFIPVNIFLGYVLPCIVFVIGKLRKVI